MNSETVRGVYTHTYRNDRPRDNLSCDTLLWMKRCGTIRINFLTDKLMWDGRQRTNPLQLSFVFVYWQLDAVRS